MAIDYNLIDYIDPEEIPELYASGKLVGTHADPEMLAEMLAKSKTPLFGAAAPHLVGTGDGRISTPYKFCLKYDEEFGKWEAQSTGDCVSHGTRNSGFLNYCVDCAAGETTYEDRLATENIYGARGHRGQGASCARLANYVHKIGGFLIRKKYQSESGRYSVDLSTYNSRIGHNWGGSGTPNWLNQIAKKIPCKTISLVTNTDEVKDANANGYGVNVCSGYGFSNKRDSNGVAEPRGRWNHAMACIASDDSEWAHNNYNGSIHLIQNSWGLWNSGGKRHDQPDGSFFVRESVLQRMLNARGSWVISDVIGYKRRKLDYMLI